MIIERIGAAAMYEQLAEEAAEMAQAALKCAQIIRGENPTPVSWDEAVLHLSEEVTDVAVCLDELGVKTVMDIYRKKKQRWMDRLEKVQWSFGQEKNTDAGGGCGPDGCDVTELLKESATAQDCDAAELPKGGVTTRGCDMEEPAPYDYYFQSMAKCAAWMQRVAGASQISDTDDIDLREEMFSRNHGG